MWLISQLSCIFVECEEWIYQYHDYITVKWTVSPVLGRVFTAAAIPTRKMHAPRTDHEFHNFITEES